LPATLSVLGASASVDIQITCQAAERERDRHIWWRNGATCDSPWFSARLGRVPHRPRRGRSAGV